MLYIDSTHAKGMDADIPFRICVSAEVPQIRAPWFSIPTQEGQTVQELYLEQLDRNDVPYVIINQSVWFFWTNRWCSYDYYLDEEWNEIKINLLVFRTSISQP